jgi:hypothetical protein
VNTGVDTVAQSAIKTITTIDSISVKPRQFISNPQFERIAVNLRTNAKRNN